ncbi:hypothetical protein Taro_042197 [Colocasia esculenta]|uniref:PLAT domain-containing protein n=1 Tax=Colocasia esculenta TaxID=4460 RepID=A0A843WS42_COLES|nr:hypothetical protein [Colocasia esculenta]
MSVSDSPVANLLPLYPCVWPWQDGGVGNCVYTVYIETGCNRKCGTDSVISLALSSEATGNGAVEIANLEEWGGLMGANHKYFNRNNLDVFSGRGPCLPGPPCWMELSSDGSGSGHRWYCNYVEVTTTGPHTNCTQQVFTVEQWLARDRVPYQLTATREYCSSSAAGRAMTKKVDHAETVGVDAAVV